MVFYQDLALLGVGLLLLVIGANFLVDSASRLAKRYGVPDFVIGLTIVAIGTSVPELAAAISASLEGEGAFVVGNVIGSNLSNICLVLGIGAILGGIKTTRLGLRRDGYIMMGVFLTLYMFMLWGNMNWIGGLLLISVFIAYIIFLTISRDELGTEGEFHDFVKFFVKFEYVKVIATSILGGKALFQPKRFLDKPKLAKLQTFKDLGAIVLGIVLIVIGAEFLINGAMGLASGLNVSTGLIGLTVVSLGTTLPEVSVSINAARKGLGSLALGNALGSCVTNILLILGVATLISPITFRWVTIAFTAPFMILVGATLLIMMHRESIGRKGGFLLIGLYGLFMVLLLGLFA
ncbi:MAG: calcium/sodium antiporter [Thermoplasmata archaeon]|nr:calcium/sodium antiporter [Thermoplasmata archaeon]